MVRTSAAASVLVSHTAPSLSHPRQRSCGVCLATPRPFVRFVRSSPATMGGCASVQVHPASPPQDAGAEHKPLPAQRGKRHSHSRSHGHGTVHVKGSAVAAGSTASVAAAESTAVPSVTLGLDASDLASPLASPMSPQPDSIKGGMFSPSSAATAAPSSHPFGTALSPAALLAFHPAASAKPEKPLPRAVESLWRERILPAPREFMATHRAEWGAIVATEAMPPRFRLAMWCAALGVDMTGGASARPPAAAQGRSYLSLLSQPSACDDQIRRDIHRTFSTEPFFRHLEVQNALGRVLHAWSLCAPEVGYVQGHNYLAAMLLSTSIDEELSWRMLLALLLHPDRERGLGAMFVDGLALLIRQCAHLDTLLAASLAPLATHLRSQHLDALMYATPVYLTLAAHHLPLDACRNVWDFVLLADCGWEDEERGTPLLPGQQPANAWGEAHTDGRLLGPSSPAASAVAASSSVAASAPLSLHRSRWTHALTVLLLSFLSRGAKELSRVRGGASETFRALQTMELLRKDKTRKEVWKEAEKQVQAWRTRNAAHKQINTRQ